MKIREIFCLVFFAIIVNIAVGRDYVVNSQNIEISAGCSSHPLYSFNLSYITLIKPRLEIDFSLSGQTGSITLDDIYKIPVSNILASASISHILFGNRQKALSLWIGLKLSGGYEFINHNVTLLEDGAKLLNESGFIYTLAPKIMFEIPVSRKSSLCLHFQENFSPISNVQKWYSEIMLGFRIRIK